MSALTVLVFAASDAVRASVCAALDRGGYEPVTVAEADAVAGALAGRTPAAVVLDLESVGGPGSPALATLRRRVGDEIPILALTSFASADPGGAGWPTQVSAFLSRPVDPDELLSTIREYLDPTEEAPAGPAPAGARARVLLADDDAIGLKLSSRLLELRGYEVIPARNGREALELARAQRPDAVLSDILMPELDGFHLCAELRSIPELALVPVVLVSANFVEQGDRRLAEDAGATAFVVKSPTLSEVFAALESSLAASPRLAPMPRKAALEAGWSARMRRQMELLAQRNMELVRRATLQEAELTVLNHIAEALGERRDVGATLSEVLAQVVERGELAMALLYRREASGEFTLSGMQPPRPDGHGGLPPDGPIQALLRHAVDGGLPVALPFERPGGPNDEARAVLAAVGASSMLLTPLRLGGRSLGVLVLAAEQRDLASLAWATYARTIGVHIAQAIQLYRATVTPPDEARARLERAERLVTEVRGLVRLLRVTPAGGAGLPLPELAELTASRVGPVDLRACLRAAGIEAPGDGGPVLVESHEGALTAALGAVALGLGPRPPRATAFEGDGAVSVHVWCDGADAGPPAARELGAELVRRLGGEVVDRAGERGVLVRLPRSLPGRLS